MNKYGEVAVKSVQYLSEHRNGQPRAVWELMANQMFGENTDSARKGCPKTTFLGLCEAGVVREIPQGTYTSSQKNKAYGLRAIELIKENPGFVHQKQALWRATVGESAAIKHNSQMDVVLALWENKMILR